MKPKAILRPDAKYDIRLAASNAVEHIIKDNPIYQNCLNCLHFNEEKEICKLYYLRPPAKVIAYGCPLWEDIEIPF